MKVSHEIMFKASVTQTSFDDIKYRILVHLQGRRTGEYYCTTYKLDGTTLILDDGRASLFEIEELK